MSIQSASFWKPEEKLAIIQPFCSSTKSKKFPGVNDLRYYVFYTISKKFKKDLMLWANQRI